MLSGKYKTIRLSRDKDLPLVIVFSRSKQVEDIVDNLLRKKKVNDDTLIYGKFPKVLTIFLNLFLRIILKVNKAGERTIFPLAAIVFSKDFLRKINNLNTPLDMIFKHLDPDKIHFIDISKDVKITIIDIIMYIFYLLKTSEYRPLKFAAVGTSGILVNEGILWFLVSFNLLPVYLASPIAIESSIVNNFLLNDFWTFKKYRSGHFIMRLLKYHLAVAAGGVVNYAVLITLTFLGIYFLLANLIGIFLGFIVNYLLSELVVWR